MAQNWVKTMVFQKKDPSPVVVPKRMNTANFEPLLSRSHPLSIAYLLCLCNLLEDATNSVPIFNRG